MLQASTAVGPTLTPLSALLPAPWNPRTIREPRFKALCQSLKADPDLLWRRPILAQADGTVYAGNMRLRAAQHLGWAEVPAVIEDVPDQLARERALRDNNAGGEWQEDDLAALVYDLGQRGADLETLGFERKELDAILASVGVGASEDAVPEPPVEPITRPGDLWLLGPHRLLCGDATKHEDVQRLMQGARAVAVLTDPPYLVGYDGLNHPSKWGQPDKNKDWTDSYGVHWDETESADASLYERFTRLALDAASEADAAWYCWHGFRRQAMLEQVWRAAGLLVHQQIIWKKNHPILSRTLYMWQHENCFMGWRQGHKPPRCSDVQQTSVWAIDADRLPGEQTAHPTSKPVDLFAIPIRLHTREGGIVYDPFLGSGTTLIAAQQLGRVCYGLEIEPRYCDVIVQRWEALTGESARRERS